METIGERIEQVLKASGIKKIEAARRLNVSSAFITQLCKGDSGASDRTISDICREFGVDEVWLRHGEGEMFRPRSRKDAISAYMGQLLGNQRSEFEEDIIEFMANTRPEFWDILIEEMRPLAKRIVEKKPPDTE
ncbi:MAG: helix-turn-helix transcriptional regulator [Candidatus Limivicinus sp.]|nr:helix-turn-helix transcriptional regulator [Candidatus Limivicinus sp.]